MFRAGSRSVIQVVLRPQNGANKLKITSLFNKNNKAISRALSTLISKKKSLIAQTNTLNEYKYLRDSRQPWFGQYRSYAEAKKDQNDNKDKAKDEEDEEMETKGKEEDEAKPDAEEAAQAGQYGGAGASVFMGSLYYLVTRQDMESTKKDSNVVLMLDLAHRRRIEEHSSIMRLNRAETLRDLVTPTIDTADHYFAYNPKVITFERAAELMKDNSNIPTLLESGAIRRVTDPEEIAKIEQMTPGEELEFKVNDRMVTKSYPNFQAAAMAWLRKPENQSLRRMMYPRKPKWRRGWYSGALWDLIKARMIYAPLLGMIAGIIASILLLLWLLLSKKSHYYFGRLTTNIRESLFAGLSLVLPFDLPTPERDYKALKETIYQELVDEGYVVLPEEIDPEPNPDEPQPEQNNSA